MKKKFGVTLSLLMAMSLFSSCQYVAQIEEKAKAINNYEKVALQLAKENRALNVQISSLKYKVQTIESENSYLKVQLDDRKDARSPASIAPVKPGSDMVKNGTYKWPAEQLITLAQDAFNKKEYEKSAQLYETLLKNYPKHAAINDSLYFQAGLASYQSGSNTPWVYSNLGAIVSQYPTSKYFRSAKLWMALTDLKEGNDKKFFTTVEEFRKKYRNTPEWKVLSAHYEKIVLKYKN